MITDYHNQLTVGVGSLALDNRTLLRTRCRNHELQMEQYDSSPSTMEASFRGIFNSRSRS